MKTYSARCKEINGDVLSDYIFVITSTRLRHHRKGDVIQVAKFGNRYYFGTLTTQSLVKDRIEEIVEEDVSLRPSVDSSERLSSISSGILRSEQKLRLR